MPPEVAALGPGHLGTGTLVDQDTVHIRALLEGLIDDALGANDLTTALALVGGDNDLGTSVDDTVTEGVGGETSEDNGVNGTNTRASQEGNNGLGDHGKVDGHGIALLHALLFQGPGDARDFPEQLAESDIATRVGLVGFIDDGNFIGVLNGVTVDAVEGGVQATFGEERIVAILERTDVGGLEIAIKGEVLPSHASPEGVGRADRLLVQRPILLDTLQVGSGRVFVIECLGDVESVNFMALGDLQYSSQRGFFFTRDRTVGTELGTLPRRPWFWGRQTWLEISEESNENGEQLSKKMRRLVL